MKNCTYKDPFYQLMFLNFKLTLPEAMLVKVDRRSMAYSLETRAPFLDYRLIDYMATVHKDIKMKKMERKSVLRATIGKKLPEAILTAPKKGFGVPLREWFKEDHFSDRLNSLENSLPFLNKSILEEIVLANKKSEGDYGSFIWMLFVLKENLEMK